MIYINNVIELKLSPTQLVALLSQLRLFTGEEYVGEIAFRDNLEIRRRLNLLMRPDSITDFMGEFTYPYLKLFADILQMAYVMQQPVYWRP